MKFLGGLGLALAITLGLFLTVLAPSDPERLRAPPPENTQHLSPRFCYNDGADWESGVCSAIGKTWPI